ncbi:MAG: hypothetical protein JXR88_00400 [Clostridia bacterium]|nr:hypothetical protein [Clostridia bacterium]
MVKKIKEIYSRSKFSRNTMPKLLSILFAVVFWIFVMDQVNPEITKQIDNVQVVLIGVTELEANGYEIMGERDFEVDVVIKGRRNEVLNISKSDIEITADLGDLKNGMQTVRLEKKLEAEEVAIQELSKDTVPIDIDAIIRKPIDVEINTIGHVPSEYIAEDMTLSLQQIFISGPETYVNLVDHMEGELNISNSTTQISKDLAVVPVDSSGEIVTGIEVETNYVTVSIPISKVAEIEIQPQYTGFVQDGYQLMTVIVNPEAINVRGKRDDINSLKYIETTPIDLNNASETFEVKTSIEVPESITINQYFDEVSLTFVIEEIITKEFNFDYSDITFINMADPLRTNINTLEGQVLIRVTAVESIIDNLSKNDIGLYIDADNFEVGEVEALIQLNKSNDFNEIEILPETITLEVVDITDTEEQVDNTVTE